MRGMNDRAKKKRNVKGSDKEKDEREWNMWNRKGR